VLPQDFFKTNSASHRIQYKTSSKLSIFNVWAFLHFILASMRWRFFYAWYYIHVSWKHCREWSFCYNVY